MLGGGGRRGVGVRLLLNCGEEEEDKDDDDGGDGIVLCVTAALEKVWCVCYDSR